MIRDALAGRVRLTPHQLEQCRRSMPNVAAQVWDWVYAFTGIRIARTAVCRGHSAPIDMFVEQVLTRPSLALWHGPRGGGKSFLSALDTHMSSRFNPRHGSVILGGSRAQSEQIYHAIRDAVAHGSGPLGSDASSLSRLLKTQASYANGSEISILAASHTSVRGPHVQSVKLDEVDEIESDIRESAMGMAMNLRGVSSSVLMTSTWHRASGPMAELIERGRQGEFPVHSFCVFEVLETCTDERSGPKLEKCPSCPIQPWCHAEFAPGPDGRLLPKAKRSDGHYSIESVIQKVRGVSKRVFESDYLSSKPKAAGIWFADFDEANVSTDAEYTPGYPVHCSIDVGVWMGMVLFQVFREHDEASKALGLPPFNWVHVFGEYLSSTAKASSAARDILRVIQERAGNARANGLLRVSIDSAGGSQNPVGPTIESEFRNAGLTSSEGELEHWPRYAGSVQDTLNLVESLLLSADGVRAIRIHPRCKHLIAALESFERKTLRGQLTDDPKDPQHPEEEMVDSLRGGLAVEFPDRLDNSPLMRRARANTVF